MQQYKALPGLLAHITVSKHQDALQFYRQETILRRIGIDIPRVTMANWMIQVGMLIQPLIKLLRDWFLGYDIISVTAPVLAPTDTCKPAQLIRNVEMPALLAAPGVIPLLRAGATLNLTPRSLSDLT